jgi:hypothetical protein
MLGSFGPEDYHRGMHDIPFHISKHVDALFMLVKLKGRYPADADTFSIEEKSPGILVVRGPDQYAAYMTGYAQGCIDILLSPSNQLRDDRIAKLRNGLSHIADNLPISPEPKSIASRCLREDDEMVATAKKTLGG